MGHLEEWRDAIGYEGIYQVSSAGNVRSLDRIDCAGMPRKGQKMKKKFDKDGYPRACLCKNGKGKQIPIHSLVAEAFIGPRKDSRLQVNHKNGVKTDNRPCNLEYVTCKENLRHAVRTGLKKGMFGEKNPRSQPVECLMNGEWVSFQCMKEASRSTGVSSPMIRHSCEKQVGTKGFLFRSISARQQEGSV